MRFYVGSEAEIELTSKSLRAIRQNRPGVQQPSGVCHAVSVAGDDVQCAADPAGLHAFTSFDWESLPGIMRCRECERTVGAAVT